MLSVFVYFVHVVMKVPGPSELQASGGGILVSMLLRITTQTVRHVRLTSLSRFYLCYCPLYVQILNTVQI